MTAPHSRVVLVLQGGGALGAYQWGVVEALHEAGVEPAWVIGTSIGAINAALITANAPHERLPRLAAFWQRVAQPAAWGLWPGFGRWAAVAQGSPAFFQPHPAAWRGVHAQLGVDEAGWYTTTPLHDTLSELTDFTHLHAAGAPRLTVGAVGVTTGAMRYFDSRDGALGVDHVMASGALPPAFPAVTIDGEPYWDGGLYSNTPIEAVLDEAPRRDSLIFAVNVWHARGPAPESLWQVMGRQKDIQFASRADSHIARQRQIHRLRHVIRDLAQEAAKAGRVSPRVKELASWGCSTTMHVAHLDAPTLDGEDHTKDIDFSAAGIAARRDAGRRDTLDLLARAPWQAPCDPLEGVVEHW